MKIVHCLGWYFPDSLGGTEVYVQGLARAQQELGHEVTVMAPRDGYAADRYQHEGIDVLRYPVPDACAREQVLGLRPHDGFERFEAALRSLDAELFHLHSLSYGCNVHHVRAARALHMATFMTAHVPGVVCPRGTLLHLGKSACEHAMHARACVPCLLEARGLPEPAARGVGRAVGALRAVRMPNVLPHGKLATVLGLPAQVEALADELHALAREMQTIFVVCGWLKDALERNGIDANKLTLLRHGVDVDPHARRAAPSASGARRQALRVGFFGRASRVKGLSVLIEAVMRLPRELAVELHAYVQANSSEERLELERLRALCASEPRALLHPALAPDEVPRAMREHDVIAVPSLWLETGPLVALEAIALQVPVIGSDRGGLRELIEPDRNGWLEPAGDVERWSARLATLARGQATLDRAAASWVPQSVAQIATAVLTRYQAALVPIERELAQAP